MTDLILVALASGAIAFGCFERWRRVHDSIVANEIRLASEAARDSARHYAESSAASSSAAHYVAESMKILADSAEVSRQAALCAQQTAKVAMEAAELYCEQLGVPKRSVAAQKRRLETIDSLVKSGVDYISAIERAG